MLPLRGPRVQSLFRELGSHLPREVARKKNFFGGVIEAGSWIHDGGSLPSSLYS